MLPWRRQRSRSDLETATVGLLIDAREACVVHCVHGEAGRPSILSWEVIGFETAAELQAGLTRFVDTHRLRGEACRVTLGGGYYSLRLVERPPSVPDEELADATRFLIRDLVEFDVEQSGIAILPVPIDGARPHAPRMFVIAARPEVAIELAPAVDGAGLRLIGVETIETTLLALDARLPEVVAGSALLRLDDKASLMSVAHDGRLYLVRHLHPDLDQLDETAQLALQTEDPTGPEIMEALDPLLLDLQRSLDYYESEFGKAPASRLTLLPGRIDASPLIPALGEAFRPMQIECLDCSPSAGFGLRRLLS